MLFPLPIFPQTQSPTAPQKGLEPVHTSVTVVGDVHTETPASITTLGAPEISKIPGVNLDDRLRTIPGFSLFRRTSSLVANPTTQGVSLRGIGSSGASRTLVLWDGVPVNDPFGGWVYWTRLAPDQMDRIEVMRGASTSVFGDRAMSGAITLFSPSSERQHAQLGYEVGNANQHALNGAFSLPFRQFAVSGGFRGYTTSGYYIVPSNLVGRADTKAGVDFVSPVLRFDYFGGNHRLFLKADTLIENRDNGTVLQRNSTTLGTVSANYTTGTVNNISILGYHTREQYHQSFSAIAVDRNSERLTFSQSVPTDATGGSLLYRRNFSAINFIGGADFNRVEGFSIDSLVPTGQRIGGGDQLQHGVFGQMNAKTGPAQIFLGLRHSFAGQDNRFLSPTGGLTLGKGPLRFRSSVYRSFRAPTLNELFREFRAGNATTLPNGALRPETLTGVEAGFDVVGETRRFGATFFRNSIDDIVTNVTLSSTPALITRQRQNAASALNRGIELDFRQRWRGFRGEASYLYTDGRFSTRERLPQIPKHQGNAQLSYTRGGTVAAAGYRHFSFQFDDDRNQFLMPGFGVAYLSVRQRLKKEISAVFSMENAFNRGFLVAFSPTPNVGAPRLYRIGLRWR